jgi:predicted type IV restriction endonuclease
MIRAKLLDRETRANYLATIILLKKFPCQTIELTYEKIKIRWQLLSVGGKSRRFLKVP